MDRRFKRILIYAGAALLLFIAVWAVLRFGFRFEIFAQKGWQGSCYMDNMGRPLGGWQTIRGEKFYFDPATGQKVIGWKEIDGKRFGFDQNGKIRTGWLTDETGTYLLRSDGSVCTGWIDTDRGPRCFDPQGVMLVGLQRSGNDLYHFDPQGGALTGWFEHEGKQYCFDEKGKALTGWQELPEGMCYFGADGAAAEGWTEIEGERYFFEAGVPHTGWLDDGQDRYFFLADGTMAVGEVIIDDVSRFFTSKGKYVVVVNCWHAVPEDYTMELVDVEGHAFDISGAQALEEMLKACREAGYECYINNTYRSVYTQQRMYQKRIKELMDGGMNYYMADYVITQSLMIPGHSEHHLGLAVDLHGSDAMFEWLGEHCWEYGFILRYPEGKFDKTGVIHEPWHFRYVGTELSLELQGTGLCLEEYMEQLTMSTTDEQMNEPAA